MGLLDDKRRARVFYRFLSHVYDDVNPVFWNEEMRERCLDLFDPAPDDRVLDVGCGTGFGTLGLLERTDDVEALDQSEHQLDRARAKEGLEDVDFVRGDAEHLPYRDGAFDGVWSSGSIEYWPDPVAALREAHRVVKPGGRILVVGPRRPSNRVLARMADAVMLFYDEEEATRMFEEAGWSDVEHHVMGSDWIDDDALVTSAHRPA